MYVHAGMYVRIPCQELLLYCTFLLHKRISILDYSEFILIFRVLEMQIRFNYTVLRLRKESFKNS